MTQAIDPLEVVGIVKKAIDGDVEAYGELYRLYMERIFRYVLYQVGNRTMAEDITEEVFLKSWKAIKSCRGRETTFSAWIYRVAHNQAVDTLRKNHRETLAAAVPVSAEPDPGLEAEKALEMEKVMEAIATLPEPQKQVIWLKFLEGADNREIEQILGKRAGAVRALQMRALANLRKRVGAGGNGHGA